MNKNIKILNNKISIRSAGFDEYWLQSKICEDPSILTLGNLVQVSREKRQSSGGKLDILLMEPQYKNMYEVEVMLGETDPSHIIRSIEYWDIEKRKYPQRQHFSVLVAESFDRRYFNVIQILSLNVPMIAIQAELYEMENDYFLNFRTLLNVYEEPEEEEPVEPASESTWKENANWTLKTANKLISILSEIDKDITPGFTQSYIKIIKNGKLVYSLSKKAEPKSYYVFREKIEANIDQIKSLLDSQNISYTYDKYYNFVLTIDESFIEKNKKAFQDIHKIRMSKDETDEIDV
ncbi:MAG: hypothetical protein GX556_18260 [Fibrobacter sp.]|nr:hypothetical protein [Fibrobacter sp.]